MNRNADTHRVPSISGVLRLGTKKLLLRRGEATLTIRNATPTIVFYERRIRIELHVELRSEQVVLSYPCIFIKHDLVHAMTVACDFLRDLRK